MSTNNFLKSKDYIQKNEEIECESLHILQDAKEDSIVEARHLCIDGYTDEDSSQFAHFAQINKHKGTLRCHHAEISTLDGGEIHATKVDIKECLSGSIYAQEVSIDTVQSNLKIYAANSITINSVKGSNNHFTIN